MQHVNLEEPFFYICEDQGIALTSCALTWSLGEVIPEDVYANMTVLQILKKCHVVLF
jgi:hypothetical protein